MQNLPRVGMAIVLLYGGYLVIHGELGVGAILAFNAYLLMLQVPFQVIGNLIMLGQRSSAAAKRLYEVLDEKPEIAPEVVFEHGRPDPDGAELSLRRLIHPYWPIVLLGGVFVVLEALTLQAGPKLTQIGFDDGITARDSDTLVLVAIAYLVSLVVTGAAQAARVKVTGRIAAWVMNDLRVRVCCHGGAVHLRRAAGADHVVRVVPVLIALSVCSPRACRECASSRRTTGSSTTSSTTDRSRARTTTPMSEPDGSTRSTRLAFLLSLGAFFQPIQQLVQLYNTCQQGQSSIVKLRELLSTRAEVAEAPGAVDLPKVEGETSSKTSRSAMCPTGR